MKTEIVEKPWGRELIWAKNGKYVGKILFVKKGERLSKQYHNIKDETMLLYKGEVDITIGEETRRIKAGEKESFEIKPGVVHRIEAIEDSEIIEVSTPELWDVVRIEDSYSRK